MLKSACHMGACLQHGGPALLIKLSSAGHTWKSALMASKRLESSGSCTLMSALPTKMDSSACHFFWTSSQVFSTTSTVPSFRCQLVTISRNLGLPCRRQQCQ